MPGSAQPQRRIIDTFGSGLDAASTRTIGSGGPRTAQLGGMAPVASLASGGDGLGGGGGGGRVEGGRHGESSLEGSLPWHAIDIPVLMMAPLCWPRGLRRMV